VIPHYQHNADSVINLKLLNSRVIELVVEVTLRFWFSSYKSAPIRHTSNCLVAGTSIALRWVSHATFIDPNQLRGMTHPLRSGTPFELRLFKISLWAWASDVLFQGGPITDFC